MDEQVIKDMVEKIIGLDSESEMCSDRDDFAGSGFYQRESAALTAQLEEQGVTLDGDDENPDLVHVFRDEKTWLDFNIAEWEWQEVKQNVS